MASLKVRNGTFYAQWSDAARTPVQKRLSLGTRNRKTALRLLERAEDAARLRKWDPWVDPISVLDTRPAEPIKLMAAALAYLADRKDSLQPVTHANYSSMLTRFAQATGAGIPFARLAPADVARFACSPDIARTTMRTRLIVLRAFCSWGVAYGHLAESPAVKVDTPPPPARLPKAVRTDDLDAICEAVRKDQERRDASGDKRVDTNRMWLIPCFRFAAVTGLRAAELSRLMWGDVDIARRLLVLETQKSGKAGTVPLSVGALAVLDTVEGVREPDDYVFCPPCSYRTTRTVRAFATNLNRYFTRYKKAAGITRRLTLHGLRHGFCTRLAEAGQSAFVIQAAARHASVKTSQVYVSISNHRLREELDSVFCEAPS